jgi:hypothetical protein
MKTLTVGQHFFEKLTQFTMFNKVHSCFSYKSCSASPFHLSEVIQHNGDIAHPGKH